MSKNVIVSLIAVAGVIVLGLGSVAAIGPPMGMHGKAPQYILAYIDDQVEELKLTPAQQEQYLALRAKLESNLKAAAAKRRSAFMELYQDVNQPNPDVRAMTGMIKERVKLIPAMVGANLDLMADFYDILNDEQKAQVLKRAKKRMNRAKEFCFDS